MNFIKKIMKPLLISFITIIISTFLFTTIEYTGLISNNAFNIIITLIIFLAFLISGIIFGKRSNKKGWFEGLKLSTIEGVIILLITLFTSTINTKNLIIYSLVFLATTIGSIIGVNKSNIKN